MVGELVCDGDMAGGNEVDMETKVVMWLMAVVVVLWLLMLFVVRLMLLWGDIVLVSKRWRGFYVVIIIVLWLLLLIVDERIVIYREKKEIIRMSNRLNDEIRDRCRCYESPLLN